MTPGFNAHVPARKPRPKIARVISEMVSEPPDEAGIAAAQTAGDGTADSQEGGTTEGVGAAAVRPTPSSVGVTGGREHIERLRERLAAAAHPPTASTEPKRTAAAVRELVEGLRARLEASARERSELSAALEEARAALDRVEGDVQRERRARAGIEAQAEERRRIADEAVVEAEALASERDQLLDELAGLRRRESEQASLLVEAEELLARRDAEREAAVLQLAEARQLLDLRAVDVADLEVRLQAEASARARAEGHCREVEAEVAHLSEAREALEAIEAMTRSR